MSNYRQKDYMKIPQVARMMTEAEQKIIRAGHLPSLTSNTDSEIAGMFDKLLQMLGLKEPTDVELYIRLNAFLRSMFADLTLQDVYNAFSFLCVGGLDEFLPRNNAGQPDREVYGKLNEMSVGRILAAYRQLMLRTYRKASYYMPKIEEKLILTNKEKMKQSNIEDVMNAFETWKATGDIGCDSLSIFFVWRMLYQRGLVPGQEPTAMDAANALAGKKSEWRKKAIKRAFEEIIMKQINLREELQKI